MIYPGLFNESYTPAPLELQFIKNPAGYLSPYLLAGLFSFLIAGLIISQAARYFTKFSATDSIALQSHVVLVLTLTALKLAEIGAVMYLDFSLNYGDYLFLTHKHWTLRISVLSATIVSATVQVFFIHRCFTLSHRSLVFLVPTVVAWLASIGSAIWVTIVFPVEWAARSYSFVQASRAAPGSTLACDLLITSFTVFYLLRSRAAFPGESPIFRLLRIALESAAPPVLTAALNVAFDAQAAGGFVFLFVALTALLQTFSMLYSLNARLYFRKAANRSSVTQSPRTSPRTLPGPLGSPFPFPKQSGEDESMLDVMLTPQSGDTFVGSPRTPKKMFTPQSGETFVGSPRTPMKFGKPDPARMV